jgi:hypothetical protein
MSDSPVTGTDVQPLGEATHKSETPTVAPTPSVDATPADAAPEVAPVAPADPAPPGVVAKAPEGVTVNSDFLDGLTKQAAEAGLSQEAVDGIVSAHVAELDGYDKAAQTHWQQQLAEWDKETAALPELKDYDTVTEPLFAKFGDAEDMKILQEAGILKIPALKRMFAKIAREAAEDSVAGAVAGNAAPVSSTSLADALYTHPTSRSTG